TRFKCDWSSDVCSSDLITMPSLNGLFATKQIAKVSPSTKVIILTVHDSDQLIPKVLDAGARGYILKADAGRDLITAAKALLSNRSEERRVGKEGGSKRW